MKYPSYPSHLEIEVTNRCQLKCPICPHRIMKRKQGDMPWEVFKAVVEESWGKSKTCYMHMIGEPLLHPHLIEMIKYIASSGIRTSISTNALLLTKDMSRKLFESGLRELTLCLDSLKKSVYESIRVGAKFELVVKNIDDCLSVRRQIPDSKTRIEVQMIKTAVNASEIVEFKKKYEPLVEGIGRVRIKGFSTFAGKIKNLAPKNVSPRRFGCSKLHTSTAILWNGDIAICCRDYDGLTVMGNVLREGISKTWKSEKYNKFRLAMRNKDFETLSFCKDC